MVFSCSAPACRSNYKTGNYIPTFIFPSDPVLRQKWIDSVPRKNWVCTKNSSLCIKHFQPEDIIGNISYIDADGTIKYLAAGKKRVRKGAIPSIWPGMPGGKNDTTPINRSQKPNETSDDDSSDASANNQPNHGESLSSSSSSIDDDSSTINDDDDVLPQHSDDQIVDYAHFVNGYPTKMTNMRSTTWRVSQSDELHEPFTVFYTLDIVDAPRVRASVKVTSELIINVHVDGLQLSGKQFHRIVPLGKLCYWSQLDRLLNHYGGTDSCDQFSSDAKHHWNNVRKAAAFLEKAAVSECHLTDGTHVLPKKMIAFVAEQLKLALEPEHTRRYSINTLCLAHIIRIKSPECYQWLRTSGTLLMPCSRAFRNVCTSSFAKSAGTEFVKAYLQMRADKLLDRVKKVAISVDQIHLINHVTNRDEAAVSPLHLARNQTANSATTVHALTISSLVGDYADLVGLVASTSSDAQDSDIGTQLIAAIRCVQESGFVVVAIVASHQSIGRRLFDQLLSRFAKPESTRAIVNQQYRHMRIYLLFDSAHLLKSIWKCWVQQPDEEQTFTYPDIGASADSRRKCQARFSHLKRLRLSEQVLPAKIAYLLRHEALCPSWYDLQQLALAKSIFSRRLVSHLREVSAIDSTISSTADFIEYINHFWQILNGKVKLAAGSVTGDESSSVGNDPKLHFLKRFADWLPRWNGTSGGKLTGDTHSALLHTVESVIELVDYAFVDLEMETIRLSRLGTRDLNARFSDGRLMSGTELLRSVQQTLDSEKKVYVSTVLSVSSHTFGEFSINEISTKQSTQSDVTTSTEVNFDLSEVNFKLSLDECSMFVGNGAEDVLICVAACAASSVIKRVFCKDCQLLVSVLDKTLKIDAEPDVFREYVSLPIRSELPRPTERLNAVTVLTYVLLQKQVGAAERETQFLACNRRKQTFVQLARFHVENYLGISEWNDSCRSCGVKKSETWSACLTHLANMFLAGYLQLIGGGSVETTKKSGKRKAAELS